MSSWRGLSVEEALDADFGIAALVGLLFAFARWRLPTIPMHVADAGILASLLLIMANMGLTQMKPNFAPSALFMIGCLIIGVSIHLWLSQKASAQQTSNCPNVTVDGGNISDNAKAGIHTEGCVNLQVKGSPTITGNGDSGIDITPEKKQ